MSISSNGETWIRTVAVEEGKVSITLSYNTDYILDVMATNCAGNSIGLSIVEIFIGICHVYMVH